MSRVFYTRRLTLPNDGGWIEIQGCFDPFDLTDDQRRMIGLMADWFMEFERTFPTESVPPPSPEAAVPTESTNQH